MLDAKGKDFLRFTLAASCIVTVIMKKEETDTIVELVQENIPLDETACVNYHLGCITG